MVAASEEANARHLLHQRLGGAQHGGGQLHLVRAGIEPFAHELQNFAMHTCWGSLGYDALLLHLLMREEIVRDGLEGADGGSGPRRLFVALRILTSSNLADDLLPLLLRLLPRDAGIDVMRRLLNADLVLNDESLRAALAGAEAEAGRQSMRPQLGPVRFLRPEKRDPRLYGETRCRARV